MKLKKIGFEGISQKLKDYENRINSAYENKESYSQQIKDFPKNPNHLTISRLEDLEESIKELEKIVKNIYDNTRKMDNIGYVNPEELIFSRLERNNEKLDSLIQYKKEIKEIKKSTAKRLYSDFSEFYSDLEKLSKTSNLELLKEKRQNIDNIFTLYLGLNQGKKPRKIRKYIQQYGERPVLFGELNKIKKLYENKKDEDKESLKDLVKDCSKLKKKFKKIRFYEGIIEANSLKEEIENRLNYGYCIKENVETENNQLESTIKNQNKESFSSLPELPEPRNSRYLELWNVYEGNCSSESWLNRLELIGNIAITLPKPKKQGDISYLKKVFINLDNFTKKGYLRDKLSRSNEYKESANKTLSLLESLAQ